MPYKTTPSINQLLNLNHHHHLCKPPSEWKQFKCNSVTLQPPHFMSLQGICTCHMYIVRLHCTCMWLCRLFTLCRYTLETMYLAQVQGVQANTCSSLFPFYALACSQGTRVNTIEFTVNEGRICTTSFILACFQIYTSQPEHVDQFLLFTCRLWVFFKII